MSDTSSGNQPVQNIDTQINADTVELGDTSSQDGTVDNDQQPAADEGD